MLSFKIAICYFVYVCSPLVIKNKFLIPEPKHISVVDAQKKRLNETVLLTQNIC